MSLPARSRLRWRRLDAPGSEESSVERVADGWRLAGALEVTEAGVHARLRYLIECDLEWRTRRAHVSGEAAGQPVRLELLADGEGWWHVDGAGMPALLGALDVDLGFTPATNLLPIRRLGLAIGARQAVRTAWMRFPELRVEPLEQSYVREAERTYRYEALVDGELFRARLDTDEFGRVLRYEGLWEADDSVLP